MKCRDITIEDIKKVKGNEGLSDEEAEQVLQDIITLCDFLASSVWSKYGQ